MVRTSPTYRDVLHAVQNDWEDYRRALGRPDRDRFDRLFMDAREHADAGGALNYPNPMVVVLFSVCLAQQRRIEDIEAELEGERFDETAGERGEESAS